MKHKVNDANFPKTGDGRVYHLGIRAGELSSLIITVGDPARARVIAKYLDHPPDATAPEAKTDAYEPQTILPENTNPSLFGLQSDRGFLTLTGAYKGVIVSIVSIGMGSPNMDFFIREGREVLDEAGEEEMVVIRFGSCGVLVPNIPVGSLVVPKSSLAVNRNYDFDFLNAGKNSQDAYRVSQPVFLSIQSIMHLSAFPAPPSYLSMLMTQQTNADQELHSTLVTTLRESLPSDVLIDDNYMNASADSFYSSQGRITSFPDHNFGLIDRLIKAGVGSLEMETFHLFHLANNWPSPPNYSTHAQGELDHVTPPPTDMPALSSVRTSSILSRTGTGTAPPASPDAPGELDPEERILYPTSISRQGSQLTSRHSTLALESADPSQPVPLSPGSGSRRRIRAAAVQMIYAERNSRAFISPEQVEALQEGTAKALLETLIKWRRPITTDTPVEAKQ